MDIQIRHGLEASEVIIDGKPVFTSTKADEADVLYALIASKPNHAEQYIKAAREQRTQRIKDEIDAMLDE